jgi:hypothetical protein
MYSVARDIQRDASKYYSRFTRDAHRISCAATGNLVAMIMRYADNRRMCSALLNIVFSSTVLKPVIKKLRMSDRRWTEMMSVTTAPDETLQAVVQVPVGYITTEQLRQLPRGYLKQLKRHVFMHGDIYDRVYLLPVSDDRCCEAFHELYKCDIERISDDHLMLLCNNVLDAFAIRARREHRPEWTARLAKIGELIRQANRQRHWSCVGNPCAQVYLTPDLLLTEYSQYENHNADGF